MIQIRDRITGKSVEMTGAEENRQAFERILLEEKGYAPADVTVDFPLEFVIDGEPYRSRIDIVVSVGGRRILAVKCAPGSLGSREREIVAAARLGPDYQIPLAAVTDGVTATVLDTLSGRKIGEGMAAVPSRDQALALAATLRFDPLPSAQEERVKLIFRTYDMGNVNRTPLG